MSWVFLQAGFPSCSSADQPCLFTVGNVCRICIGWYLQTVIVFVALYHRVVHCIIESFVWIIYVLFQLHLQKPLSPKYRKIRSSEFRLLVTGRWAVLRLYSLEKWWRPVTVCDKATGHKTANTHTDTVFLTCDLDLWTFDPKVPRTHRGTFCMSSLVILAALICEMSCGKPSGDKWSLNLPSVWIIGVLAVEQYITPHRT